LQARSDVERALVRISAVKRLTLLMSEVEGMSCAEIAAALGVPIGTVWTPASTRHVASSVERSTRGGTS